MAEKKTDEAKTAWKAYEDFAKAAAVWPTPTSATRPSSCSTAGCSTSSGATSSRPVSIRRAMVSELATVSADVESGTHRQLTLIRALEPTFDGRDVFAPVPQAS